MLRDFFFSLVVFGDHLYLRGDVKAIKRTPQMGLREYWEVEVFIRVF
jgi:hypothetical protein